MYSNRPGTADASARMTKAQQLRLEGQEYLLQLRHLQEDLAQQTQQLHEVKMQLKTTQEAIAGGAGTARVVVLDATMVDGSTVRMQAPLLLEHQQADVARLVSFGEQLQIKIQELQLDAPVLHEAASMVQTK